MTKNDLKPGMLAVTRDGRHYLATGVCDKVTDFIRNSGYNTLDSYNDDLTIRNIGCEDNKRYDIMRVYGHLVNRINCTEGLFIEGNRELLWERKEKKRMTRAEIEKELGYEIEIEEE